MKTRKLILQVLLSVALLIMALNLSCLPLAAGGYHTVGIEPDGTVVATGRNDEGQCNVGGWTNITQVAAGFSHTVGIEGMGYEIGHVTGGTVVAVGRNNEGQCDVGGWTNITQVAAGGWHTVGLESGGTVVATGRNDEGQCNVGGWTNITGGAAGGAHTVGLKDGGTVVAVGSNDEGQCNVGGWTNITQVAAGYAHTVGLKDDGHVVAVGDNSYGQCNVGGWTDIAFIAAGGWHTVGLKDDGHVVAVGLNNDEQCDVATWDLIVDEGTTCYLTISSTAGGSVTTPGEGTFTYSEGTMVNLVAEAEEGYQFDNWTGDVETVADVGDAETTITMGSDYFITANFEEIPQFDLTISRTAGGSVTTPGEGTFTYDQGTGVNLVAEAEDGYRFVNWTGDVDTIANVDAASTTITMDDNYSITANFEEEPFGGWCFIATAAYGTPMAEEIEILREFRDGYLLTNPLGQALVGLYYRASPPVAEFINEHPSLKPVVRAGLLPAVAMSAVAVNTTLAEKTAIVGLLVLVSVGVAAWATKRRGRGPQYT